MPEDEITLLLSISIEDFEKEEAEGELEVVKF